MTKPLALNRYEALISRIESIFLDARQESKKRVNQVVLDAYWKIGRQIVEVEQGRQLRAAYGDGLIDSLAQDLTERFGSGFSVSNLRYMRQFYLTYQQQAKYGELPWTHYRSLLTIKDPDLRQYYERQACEHDWSARDLDRYLKLDKVERERSARPKKAPQSPMDGAVPRLSKEIRGALYSYTMTNSPLGSVIQAPLMIDCGFQIYKEMTYHKVGPLKSGDLVTSKKGAHGYSIRRNGDPDCPRFIYKAVLERVIDGETLTCMIDAGFENWTRQSLRLRHLDAPDLKTQRGRKAKAFIQEVLRDCAFLIVHTHRNVKNDGYLADIYYLPGCSHPPTVAASGRLLNQDLIEQGLAVPV